MKSAAADFPEALKPLLEAHRYKVAYGGRGGGKSWGIATYLLAAAASKPLRVLCCREFQTSIRESVHRLLSDMISKHGLEDRFEVLEKSIRGRNGSEFLFEGLRHNVGRIRSLEGIDKVWVEEAANVSKSSWEVLIPTIRKDGSEIIVSFNPELETDETYSRFIAHPPRDSVLMKVNFTENPWFPEVLQREMEDLRERDFDAYTHVYLGECKVALEGAIYARELREAVEEGRIAAVPYDRIQPVNLYCDLGWSDMTCIWFVQHIAGELRLIDYEEDSHQKWSEYLQRLQRKNYVYGTLWLPHDAQAKSLGTGRSIEEISRAAGWRVRIVPKLSVADGINAVRTLFPSMWFDRSRCSDGVQALRHYRYDLDANGQLSRTPLHDEASHGCLSADTRVLTERGECPVSEVRVGDRVWTPCGYAEVTHAGRVKEVASLIEIGLANGAEIRCSHEHKLLTTRGFVRADTLRYSDRVFEGTEWPIRLIALCSKARRTGFRAIITGETSGVQKAPRIFTAQFGKRLTARCRRAARSIIETATRLTTPWTTSNAWASASTSADTRSSVWQQENSSLRVSWRESLRPSGMEAEKVAPGTPSTAERPGPIASGESAFASSAVGFFARLFLRAPSGAIPIARLRTCDSEGGWQWVYDLSVESHACYRANGILTSNSDALRYVAVAMQEHARAKYPAAPVRPRIELAPRTRANLNWMRW